MKRNFVFFLLVVLIAVVGCAPAEDSRPDMATVQAMVDEIWSNGNMEVIDLNYAENMVRHSPGSSVVEGREAFKESVAGTRKQFSDLKIVIVEMISHGNTSASRWTASGTHNESGNQVTFEGTTFVHTNDDGQTTEEWATFDMQSVMQQTQAGMETSMK